ncbi:MAG: hypothetical protein KAT14_08595 [Candidatus Marinimicrobia bacterium]|nr:hypothetical protein [Candidatus Neomarinimicrobiota bacterium]
MKNLDRQKILEIYRDSKLKDNIIKKIFNSVMDLSGNILDVCPMDGTTYKILMACDFSGQYYVVESDKKKRADFHKQGIKIIDDRKIEDIDLIRTCGNYRKYPGCTGCKNDPAKCECFLGLPDKQFNAVIGMKENSVLQKFSGNVILLDK